MDFAHLWDQHKNINDIFFLQLTLFTNCTNILSCKKKKYKLEK